MPALRIILIILAAIILFPVALCLTLLLLYVLICILCSITELICGVFTAPLLFLKSRQKDCDKQQEKHDREV